MYSWLTIEVTIANKDSPNREWLQPIMSLLGLAFIVYPNIMLASGLWTIVSTTHPLSGHSIATGTLGECLSIAWVVAGISALLIKANTVSVLGFVLYSVLLSKYTGSAACLGSSCSGSVKIDKAELYSWCNVVKINKTSLLNNRVIR